MADRRRCEPARCKGAIPDEPSDAGRPPTLIVAALDEDTAAALADELTRSGCAVAGAFAGASGALRLLTGGRPDVVIVDARLTDAPALQLATTLRQRGIRIVYFTSYDAEHRTIRAEAPDEPGSMQATSLPELLRQLG